MMALSIGNGMRAIHQIVAGYANGDAISNEARTMRALFRSWGHESHIYSEQKRILPELRGGITTRRARDAMARHGATATWATCPRSTSMPRAALRRRCWPRA